MTRQPLAGTGVALVTHEACLAHDTGHHPECADRLRAILSALDHPDFAPLLRLQAPQATRAQLLLAHPPAYVDRILALRAEPDAPILLDADTVFSAGSLSAALYAAGGACAAVDAVLSGKAGAAFVATRPPGHHAEPAQAMGFCIFANAAIAALHARARWGLRRIAVVDFDVHHGNGTQAVLWDEPELLFASSHQSPCYPGSGAPSECGVAKNIVNVPLPPGTDGPAFRSAWTDHILPVLDRYAPELIIVSAGFDAHRDDPLADMRLDSADFAWITAALLQVADRHCGGRTVSVLEGGYDLDALAESAVAHLRALMRIA